MTRRRSARWSRATTPALPPATSSSASSAGRTTPSCAPARCARSARARPADARAARDRRDGVHRVLRPARRLRAEARRHGCRLGRGRRGRADRRPDREAGGLPHRRDRRRPRQGHRPAKLYGYDVAIDYKNDDVRASLKEACPDGVDVYFDNVGGEISAAVHGRLNVGARIVICGQVSQYNAVRARAELPPRAADRLPREDAGLPRQRLRAPLRRGGAPARALGRRGQAAVARGRDRRPGERTAGVPRDAPRREPRQGARQGRRPSSRARALRSTCVQRALARCVPSAS